MEYLKWFKTDVSPTEKGYRVTYSHGEFSGTVDYMKYEMENRLMKGKDVFLMTHCDMGDVIEIIHQNKPLSSYDYNNLNMEIRTHSRKLVMNYKKTMGKSL